jgi:hypothetical protein
VRADQGFERSLEDLIAATPLTYLTSASWIHYETWSHYLYGDGSDTFFPGVVAVVLALGSIVTSRQTWLNPRVRSVLAVGIVGFLLSLGAATPLYGWLYSVFPPMWGMRAASRFGNLTLLAVAVLAGWGLARLRERWGDWRWALPLTVATLIVANVEARHGTTYVPFEGIPDLYKLIAADEHAVVAAFPFYMPPDTPMNGREMVASTAHFRPLLNGYSGFTPQSYRDAADVLWWFPSPESFDLLARRKVRYLVLHLSRYDPSEQESILQTLAGRHELHLLRVDKAQELRLYRFDYEAHAAAAAPASSGGS